ncbi:MAG: DUF2336 domain-containing protein, partial [Rhodospirillales bacterium]|nr:DUF2336 domain-containing protein [Rhodospirillales bacterium]
MTAQLSQADVAKLTSDPSVEVRAEMAAKVATQFDRQKLSAEERAIAEDIFRSLLRDAEVRVREALSSHLKTSSGLSHDVAMGLAKDVDSVSLPMLQFSDVLSDDDLIEIVRGHGGAKQEVIAQRATVSAEVAEALIDTGNETAVTHLVENEGAELGEQQLERVVKEFEASEAVSAALCERPDLPAAVSEQLMNVVTQHLQNYLVVNYRLPADMVRKLLIQARERATAGLLSDSVSSEEELEELLDQMH